MLCVLGSRSTALQSDLLLSNHLIKSACCFYAGAFYRYLGETTQGKGGSPAAIPLPLPGFLPQSPAFRLPHPPMACTHRLHIFTMLHKTLRDEIYFMKSWKLFSPFVSPREGRVVEKRAREKTGERGENKHRQMRSLHSQRGCRSHSGKPILRKRSTQIIKDHTKENGHKR